MLPIHEAARDYRALAHIHSDLKSLYQDLATAVPSSSLLRSVNRLEKENREAASIIWLLDAHTERGAEPHAWKLLPGEVLWGGL